MEFNSKIGEKRKMGNQTKTGLNLDVGFPEIREMPDYLGDIKTVEKAIQYLVMGLGIDGGHHKQWCIEQAVKSLGVDLEDLRSELDDLDTGWEDGIAP